MPLADILGQDRAVAQIRRAWMAGRLAQAYRLVGPEGVGKRTTALALAQAVNCQRPAAGEAADACDTCPACRKIAAGNHPDVTLVRPAEKTVIDIEQIREVAARAGRRPYEGAVKVWILDPAERMQEAAANAFLKTLEEPPGAALFLLVTAAPAALLPTIRSRCQEVRFDLLETAALQAILERRGVPADQARERAGLAGGSAARALDPELAAAQAAQAARFEAMLGCLSSVPAVLAQAEALDRELRAAERAEAVVFLETLTAFVRDVAVVRMGAGAAPPCHPAWAHAAAAWAAVVSPPAVLEIAEALRQARWALQPERNANRRLTLERLLFRMREAIRTPEEVEHAQLGAR